ncbi:Xaa-Pro peptidase family protein [Lentibacillus sp. CBA3610]|uniref:M24 family metallopeptidase n=1 Tax=Lentibacillus sp. CBA3610 TaxID=2518176 RepID=UPI001595CFF8|nr:Xaa-Pro peptidase family protein [Lentibacillus sp. CBA3610]QKY69678.1 aminopeptidase P family protein [Lentibacillus sp. CBA3610]
MTNRLDTLLGELKKHNLDSMLVTSAANFYYLSNYYTDPHERVIAVYISRDHDPLLIVPAMEKEDAKNAGWEYEIIAYNDHESPWALFQQLLKRNNSKPESVAVEHNHLTLERYEQVKSVLPDATFHDAQEILANLRVIKSSEEYALLKEAARFADFGIETGIKAINEGAGELEIIAKIEYELKKQGIQQMSFSTMALSGAKTASPHGTPSMKKIEKGDLVLFDLGVIYEGYCSDITRTVAYKSISPEQESIYNTVLEAETQAITSSKQGTAVGDVDLAARNHIDKKGYGEYFIHRIGHGLGIETHEYPSMHSQNKLPLKTGMCYTIEPGIYVPGQGGVRIEDMVFMSDSGAETLTKFPKELQIVD